MNTRRIKNILNIVIIILLFGGISYCAYNFASAEKRIKALCSKIPIGMSFVQLSGFAKQHGLSRPHNDSGTTFITESKTFGRYACEIQLSNGIVQDVKYNFAD
jgi:hypothetical protein